jgi:hypothetical protein
VVIGLLPAFKNSGANKSARPHSSAVAGKKGHLLSRQHISAGNPQKLGHIKSSAVKIQPLSVQNPHAISVGRATLDSVTKLLRLKLYIDQYNYDDIAIGFNSGASAAYNPYEDSEYLQGIDAPEGLSCFSSDGVALSIDLLPLPQQSPDVIRLDVETQDSRQITLKRTELDSLPKMYNLWLVDNYKKDSIDLRVDSNYVFTINKSDTATFGAWRFKVVITKTPPPAFKLVDFNAIKGSGGADITWATQNEGNDTHFAIERSTDDGSTFSVLDSLVANGGGSYSFTDNTPPAAADEYRVKITDASGTVSYSNVVTLLYTVSAPIVKSAVTIYPNPTNGMINLMINQNNNTGNNLVEQSTVALAASTNTGTTSYSIKIVNISGTTIKSAVSSTGSWQDNVSALSAGTYIITVVDNSSNKLVGRSTFVKL